MYSVSALNWMKLAINGSMENVPTPKIKTSHTFMKLPLERMPNEGKANAARQPLGLFWIVG